MALLVQTTAKFTRTLIQAGSHRTLAPAVQARVARCQGTWQQPMGPMRAARSWPCEASVCNPSSMNGLAHAGASHIPTPSPLVLHVNTMKKRTAIKRRCKDCKIVIRDKRAYVICKTSPRHNQVQG